MENKNVVKIKAWHILLVAVIAVVAIVLKIVDVRNNSVTTFNYKGQGYSVLIARDSKSAYKGLSGQKDLGEYAGMLFVFQQSDYYTMVMRDMNFPIDIIWLDNDMVVDMAPDVKTEPGVAELSLTKYRPRSVADKVLELKSGFIRQNNLKIGDKIEFSK